MEKERECERGGDNTKSKKRPLSGESEMTHFPVHDIGPRDLPWNEWLSILLDGEHPLELGIERRLIVFEKLFFKGLTDIVKDWAQKALDFDRHDSAHRGYFHFPNFSWTHLELHKITWILQIKGFSIKRKSFMQFEKMVFTWLTEQVRYVYERAFCWLANAKPRLMKDSDDSVIEIANEIKGLYMGVHPYDRKTPEPITIFTSRSLAYMSREYVFKDVGIPSVPPSLHPSPSPEFHISGKLEDLSLPHLPPPVEEGPDLPLPVEEGLNLPLSHLPLPIEEGLNLPLPVFPSPCTPLTSSLPSKLSCPHSSRKRQSFVAKKAKERPKLKLDDKREPIGESAKVLHQGIKYVIESHVIQETYWSKDP